MTKNNNLPTSILLTGSTGTGKTYLIEEYAKNLNLNLIKINLDEYISEISINKIIGSPAGYIGYDQKNTIFESIKNFPISIILLENYDSAPNNILNLFYNTLETGTLKLSNNETINFSNCMLIFTSNTKAENNKIGFINKEEKPIINKFNHYISLNDLNKETIIKLIKKQNELLSDEDINNIIKRSNFIHNGAKNLKNIINEISVNL